MGDIAAFARGLAFGSGVPEWRVDQQFFFSTKGDLFLVLSVEGIDFLIKVE